MKIEINFSPGLITDILIDPPEDAKFICTNYLMSKVTEYDKFLKTYHVRRVPVFSNLDKNLGLIQLNSGLIKSLLLELVYDSVVSKQDISVTDTRSQFDKFHLSKIDIELYRSLYNFSKSTDVPLRDYQFDGIKTLLSTSSGILAFPTSSGKGEIIVALSKILQPFGQVLILVPSMASLKSTQERLEDYQVKFYQYHNIRNQSEVDGVILSTPKVISNDIDKKSPDSILNNIQYLLTNEVHHVQAKTWHDVSSKLPSIVRSYGFSATPEISSNALIRDMSLRESMIRGTHGSIVMEVASKDIETHISVPDVINLAFKSKYVKQEDFLNFDWTRIRHYLYSPDRIEFIAKLVNEIHSETDLTTITFVSYIETQGNPLFDLYPQGTLCWYGGGVVLNNANLDIDKDSVFEAIKERQIRHTIVTSHAREDINLPVLNVALMLDLAKKQSVKQCVGRVVRKGSPSFFVNISDESPKVLMSQAKKRSKYISEEYGVKSVDFWSIDPLILFLKNRKKG